MRIINVLNLNTIYSIPRKRNVPINHLLIHVSSRKENACCPSIVFASNNVTETDSETLHRLVHICSLHFWLAQRGFKPVSIELSVTFVICHFWLFSVDSTTGFPATVVDKQIELDDIS